MALTSAPYRWVVRRLLLPWVLGDVQLAGRGLEIGAGSGAMAAEILERFPALEMVVTDLDPTMVAKARTGLAGFGGRVELQVADAAALPFPDGHFDFVLTAAMLHHVQPPQRAVAEVARVLRPGGLLLGYDVTDTLPVRIIHLAEGGRIHLLHPQELRSAIADACGGALVMRDSLAGSLVRFRATKAS